MRFIVLHDTREKKPWNLTIYEDCKGQIKTTLGTGDYTVQGYEDDIIIERKKTTSEISNNITKKSKQFREELARMQDFRFRYLICEFTINNILQFPVNSGIPPILWPKIQISGQFIFNRLNSWCEEFGIESIFCNNRNEAEEKAMQLMKEAVYVIKKENKKQKRT